MKAKHVLKGRRLIAPLARQLTRQSVVERLLLMLLLLVAGSGLAIPSALAREATDQIKASYIFNFLKFVTFPAGEFSSDNIVRVCLVGRDHFGNALDAIDGRFTGQGNVEIVRLGPYRSALSFDGCHVIYVMDSEAHKTERILAGIDSRRSLTIGEYVPFVDQGGMIELFEKDDTIRFRINAELVKDAKFQIASQLILLGVE